MKKAIILSAVLGIIGVFAISAQRRTTTTDNKTAYAGVCPVDSCIQNCPGTACPMDTLLCADCPNYRQVNNRRASSCCRRYNHAKGCHGHRGRHVCLLGLDKYVFKSE